MDSTMMWIVHQAMNNAHEKMQSKEGVLERLNGICRFYELAVMQLEGCLKFVRQETDSYILESSDEQMLQDLSDIRNRLQRRLKEAEMAIMAKDRELASLRASTANLKLERRTKSEPVEDYIRASENSNNNYNNGDDDDGNGGDNELFCELKNSVDQQVLNIRQKLEPDYTEVVVEGMNSNNKKRIEQMGSDMGTLKETLDLAFGKMQNAIFRSECGPIEQQWRWGVERDTMSVLLQGFMRDFQRTLEAKQVSLGINFREYWSDFMEEVENVRRELESFVAQNEGQLKGIDSMSATSLGWKVLKPPNEKHSPDDQEAMDEQVHEEERGDEGGNFVSKMIKNHESIIRKKSAEAEELNLLKREILRQKCNLSSRREEIEMQENSLKRRVQEVIHKLDKLRDWDAKLVENFDHFEFDHETLSENSRFQKSDASDHNDNLELDTLEDIWEKMDKIVPYAVNEVKNEARVLKQEQEDQNLECSILEKTYVTLLEGIIRENSIKLYDYELENLIWMDLWNVLLTETAYQWKEKDDSYKIEAQTREDIYCTILRESIKHRGSHGNYASIECRARSRSFGDSALSENLECTIREDVWSTLSHEIFKEYAIKSLIREDIEQTVLHESIKPMLAQNQDIVTSQKTESFVREEIYMVFIRESIKEWKEELNAFEMERFIGEEMNQFVIVQALKDAFLFSNNVLHEGRQANAEERFNIKMEDLLLSTPSSETKKQDDVHIDFLGGLEFEESKEPNISKDLLTKGHTFCSMNPAELSAHYKVLVDFEHATREKLEMNSSRLKNTKHDVDTVVELVSSLRKKESIYRDAFTRRCQDLWKAETEVDLLGDQVEALVSLLEKIYTKLCHHSPVLQQYVDEFSDILQLIKEELTGVVNAPKN